MSISLSWKGWLVMDEIPVSVDIVQELLWVGHPLMIEAATEIKRLYAEVNDLRLQVVALTIPQEAHGG